MLPYIRLHRFTVIILVFIICGTVYGFAGDVSLAWDPSPSENVVGYKVYYGHSSGTYDSFQTVTGQTTCTLPALTDGTYYFAVTAFDSTGNESGYSNEVFTTVGNVSGDTTPPVISGVGSSGITANGATISWTTNEAATTQVEYGTTASYGGSTTLNTTLATTHSQSLSGLASGTVYHYRVRSTDAAGNLAVSGDRTFTTSMPVDTTPPVISGVGSSGITENSATISWTTNEAATTQVEYGTTTSYGGSTTLNTVLTTAHSQALGGLTSGTVYHYRVKSTDTAGNTAVSGDYTFTLSDETAPVISSVVVSGQTGTQATITWMTDEDSDSQIEYGKTMAYGSTTTLDSAPVTSHGQVINGLETGAVYYFRVLSSDKAGNPAESQNYSFTAVAPASTLTMPLLNSVQIAQNDDMYVGMAITNTDVETATIIFTAFDEEGNRITGEGITNPAVRQLNPGTQLSKVDVEVFGDSLAGRHSKGWVRAESSTDRIRGFFMGFDGLMHVLDGVGFGYTPLENIIFTDIETNGRTQISLINNNAENAGIRIDLVQANGSIRDTFTDTLPSYGSITANIYTELFQGAQQVSTDYLRVSAGHGIQSFLMTQKTGADISFITAQDAGENALTLYSPQYLFNKQYQTGISIVNLDSTAGIVRFRLYGEGGVQIGQTEDMPVGPNGKVLIDDPEFFMNSAVMEDQISDVLQKGADRIAGALFGDENKKNSSTAPSGMDGYVKVEGNGIRMTGSVVIRDRNGKTFASALPLVANLQQSFVFSHVASNDIYFTSIALVNPGNTGAEVTLDLYDTDGKLVSERALSIPASHRIRNLLTDIFPQMSLTGQTKGYLRISASVPVAAYSVFGTNDMSVLSAIPGQ